MWPRIQCIFLLVIALAGAVVAIDYPIAVWIRFDSMKSFEVGDDCEYSIWLVGRGEADWIQNRREMYVNGKKYDCGPYREKTKDDHITYPYKENGKCKGWVSDLNNQERYFQIRASHYENDRRRSVLTFWEGQQEIGNRTRREPGSDDDCIESNDFSWNFDDHAQGSVYTESKTHKHMTVTASFVWLNRCPPGQFLPDNYMPQGDSIKCSLCPKEQPTTGPTLVQRPTINPTDSPNGASPIVCKRGYFGDKCMYQCREHSSAINCVSFPDRKIECNASTGQVSLCPRCKKGYAGTVCADCDTGYKSQGSSIKMTCEKLDVNKSESTDEENNSNYIIVVGAVAGVIIIAVVCAIFYSRSSRHRENISGKNTNHSRTVQMKNPVYDANGDALTLQGHEPDSSSMYDSIGAWTLRDGDADGVDSLDDFDLGGTASIEDDFSFGLELCKETPPENIDDFDI